MISEAKKRSLWVWLLLFCLLGLAVRLWGITRESFSLDEATSLHLARLPLPELFHHLQREDVHPPLYFLLLHFWRLGGESPSYLRLFSVLMGVLTIPAVFFLGRLLFERRAGLVAAFLLSLAPLHVEYSQIVRNYSLFILLTVLSFACLLRAVGTNRGSWWSLYGISAAACLLTHYYSIIAILAQNIAVAVILLNRERKSSFWRPWIAANAFSGVVVLVWVARSAVFTEGLSPEWLSAEPAPGLTSLTSTLIFFSLGRAAGSFPSWLRYISYLVFGGLLLASSVEGRAGRLFIRFRRRRAIWTLWAYFLVPLASTWAISQAKHIYVLRYLSPFLIPYFLLLATGIEHIKIRWKKYLALGLAVIFLVVGILFSWRTLQESDWRQAASYVLQHFEPGDVVAFTPPYYWKVFDYYAQDLVPVQVLFSGDKGERIVLESLEAYSRLWLVEYPVRYWEERSEELQLLLDSRFESAEVTQIPPNQWKIHLYLLRKKIEPEAGNYR